jgi:hypothetical protein
MKHIYKKGVVTAIFALLLTVSGFGMGSAHAASGGLTVSPTSIDKTIAPGATLNSEMLVINQSELDYNYKVYVTPYSVNGEEYKPYFNAIPGALDVTKWFSFGKTESVLKVGSQDSIPFTVKVPQGTGAGSYYATVFAETEDKGSNGVLTRKRVGTIVYIRVSGDAKEQGSVAEWGAPWLQELPLKATLKVANEGSVHFQAKVNVTVSDLFGGVKFAYERDPQIIPQKLRDIPIVWENGATFGLFKVEGSVSYLNKNEQLPMKIVFIANTPMRIVTFGVPLVIIAGLIFLGRKRVVEKK